MQVERGLAPLALIDEIVPVGDLVVHRTAGVAIGNAAIHAARRLLLGVAIIERDGEFAEMADAVGSRRILLLLPIDFKKAGDLAHRRLLMPSRRRQTKCLL